MSDEPRAIQCARLRRQFWRDLAHRIMDRDPDRAKRLFAMADGISYAVADHEQGTDPDTMRRADERLLADS